MASNNPDGTALCRCGLSFEGVVANEPSALHERHLDLTVEVNRAGDGRRVYDFVGDGILLDTH